MHAGQSLGCSQPGGETGGKDHNLQPGERCRFHCYHVGMKNDPANLQHRPFMTPVWLLAIAAFVSFSIAVCGVWIWGTADSTTVIVIRHAEKEPGSLVDPPLSAAGEARAALLSRIFGDSKGLGSLDAIYISPALRNRMTAAPLAKRLGLVPIVASTGDSKGLVQRVLRDHSGGRVLIIGHLDTVPEIVSILAGRGDVPKIDEQDFGVMYIVTVPRIGHANLLRLIY
jgi:phosphohistidine phosphatase SixA